MGLISMEIFFEKQQKIRAYPLTRGEKGAIMKKMIEVRMTRVAFAWMLFARACKQERGVRRRRSRRKIVPGNSENIRFIVAFCGELSNE